MLTVRRHSALQQPRLVLLQADRDLVGHPLSLTVATEAIFVICPGNSRSGTHRRSASSSAPILSSRCRSRHIRIDLQARQVHHLNQRRRVQLGGDRLALLLRETHNRARDRAADEALLVLRLLVGQLRLSLLHRFVGGLPRPVASACPESCWPGPSVPRPGRSSGRFRPTSPGCSPVSTVRERRLPRTRFACATADFAFWMSSSALLTASLRIVSCSDPACAAVRPACACVTETARPPGPPPPSPRHPQRRLRRLHLLVRDPPTASAACPPLGPR